MAFDDGLDKERDYETMVARDDYESLLIGAASRYLSEETFSAGEVVRWKDSLRSHRFPDYGRPMVYLGNAPSSSDRELFVFGHVRDADSLVGYLDGEGDFVVIAVESRRLTHFHGSK